MTNPLNVTKVEHNDAAASPSPIVGLPMPAIRPHDAHPVTPSKVKSKLNPAIAAFTPSDSSGKNSGKSVSVQVSSPTKDEFKPSVTATNIEEKGFISPYLRRISKISIEEEPITTTEELHIEDKFKYQDAVATSSQNEAAEEARPLQTPSLTPRILPHLRRLNSVFQNENLRQSQMQSLGKGKKKEDTAEHLPLGSVLTGTKENVQTATQPGTFDGPGPGLEAWLDTQEKSHSNNASSHDSALPINDVLIELDPDSPQAGKKKKVPLPPGFVPISANDAPAKTETTAPIKTIRATSPVAVFYNPTDSNPFSEQEEATTERKVPTKMTEMERNAAFLAEYTKTLNSIGQKYGRDSHHGSDAKEDEVEPVQYEGAKSV